MILETTHYQHIGGRDEQQDRVDAMSGRDGKERLVVVADGMGGHAGGSIAAQAVIDTARRVWSMHQAHPMAPRALLERIIAEAHEAVNRAGAERGIGPRSTCVILYLTPDTAAWAHVGDSRLYRFRGTQFVARSRDHSVVQMLVDLGKVREEEMGTHPDQNRLTQSLGGDAPPLAEYGQAELKVDDTFVLCSDGLWEMIRVDELAGLGKAEKLAETVERMTKTAFERAGARSDNISIAVARALERAPVAAAEPRKAKSFAWAAVIALAAVGAAFALLRPWEPPAAGPGSPPPRDAKPAPPPEQKQEPKTVDEPKTPPQPPEPQPTPPQPPPPAPPPEPQPPPPQPPPQPTPPQPQPPQPAPQPPPPQPAPPQPPPAPPPPAPQPVPPQPAPSPAPPPPPAEPPPQPAPPQPAPPQPPPPQPAPPGDPSGPGAPPPPAPSQPSPPPDQKK